ncbi:hypothetical protein AAFF_G00291110 [Aldrovandia affinis]|uniref:Ephrin-B3 n=1 Tax=Aldrovandia affinis TaxID=143900 RepID=A0AAD7W0T7_9TELE|nr:hypothetical protein AAFF_G00291110 [Aldrovandia affinis]
MGEEALDSGVTMAYRKGANGLRILVVFLVDLLRISATNMEPIYWNSLNKRFGDGRGYVLYPQIGDRLDLICPASPPEYEYYRLYLVSAREQADRCEVTGAPNLLLTCDRPHSDTRFTIKFQEFSPNLWGHEFHTLRDYYIIATSDGTRQGLDSMRGGVCVTRGMKVVLKVGQTPYGLPQKPPKPDQKSGRSKNTGPAGNGTTPGGSDGAGGGNGPLPFSNVVLIAGGAGGSAFLLLVAGVVCAVCYRRRRIKQADSGSEPSDIIIPLRTSDSAYCPHYEKVSGDYGHPVYIVQEMPPQSPANIYYKV